MKCAINVILLLVHLNSPQLSLFFFLVYFDSFSVIKRPFVDKSHESVILLVINKRCTIEEVGGTSNSVTEHWLNYFPPRWDTVQLSWRLPAPAKPAAAEGRSCSGSGQVQQLHFHPLKRGCPPLHKERYETQSTPRFDSYEPGHESLPPRLEKVTVELRLCHQRPAFD